MNIYQIWDNYMRIREIYEWAKLAMEKQKEQLRKKQRWGFSKELFEREYIVEYIESFKANCLWWIGRSRKKSDDKFLEKNRPWNIEDLELFLCSRQGWRWFHEEDYPMSKKWVKELYENFIQSD